MAIKIKRFKTEDGREGTSAPIGNGLIKLLFDDGEMLIIHQNSNGEELDETGQVQE